MSTKSDLSVAYAVYNEGNYDAVIELCNDVLVHEPKNDGAYRLKGMAIIIGDYEKANKTDQQVRDALKQQAEELKREADSLKEKSEEREKQWWKDQEDLRAQDKQSEALVYFFLGQICELLGYKKMAAKYFKEFLKICKSHSTMCEPIYPFQRKAQARKEKLEKQLETETKKQRRRRCAEKGMGL